MFNDPENAVDPLKDEQFILNYRFNWQSVYDLSDCLELDHNPFLHLCSSSCIAINKQSIVLCYRIIAVSNGQSISCSQVNGVSVSNALSHQLSALVKLLSKLEVADVPVHFFNVVGFPRVCGVIL